MRFSGPVPDSSTALYVASQAETIPYVSVQNDTNATKTIQVTLKQSRTGNSTSLINGTLTAYGSAIFDQEINLDQGDSIVGVAGAASSVTAQIP